MNAVAPAVTSIYADRIGRVPAPERSVATSRSALQLRPYQGAAVERSIKAVLAGRRVLVVMPTGSGKSLVIAEICRRLPHLRIAVLTHVKELVEQNHGELLALWPEAPAGICCAGLGRFDTDARILFGSVQTVANRLDDIGPVDLILVDEVHLVPRATDTRYRQVLDALDAETGRRLPVVGLTATPYRLDSGRLDRGDDALFDGVEVDIPITDLVPPGWLVPLVSKSPEERLSTEGVHIRGGEYIAGELQQAVDRPDVNARVVAEMVERGAERRAWLVYCAGVSHAEHVAALLRQHSIDAATVFGATPRAKRDGIIEAFRAGRLRALVNVNVLTTGFNAPGVDLLAVLRPTASPGLHVQMLGRGTRMAPGKQGCLVLDFAGNVARHGPLADIRPPRARRPGERISENDTFKVCSTCRSYVPRAATKCEDCGHSFAPKRRAPELSSAADLDPLYQRQWWPVRRVAYKRHQKPGKPPVLRVGYLIDGNRWISEFVPFESPKQFARIKASEWWKQRAPGIPTPTSADRALSLTRQLAAPDAVSLARDGEFARVVDARFGGRS